MLFQNVKMFRYKTSNIPISNTSCHNIYRLKVFVCVVCLVCMCVCVLTVNEGITTKLVIG